MRVGFALICAALATAGTPGHAFADDDEDEGPSLTGNVTLTSDYRFRGQSQTDRDGAVQGGIDYAHPSGFFAGIWASTIDFNDAQQSPAEVDFLAGYSHTFSDETTASLALAYYWYPDSDPADYDYIELLGNVAHDFGSFALSGDVTYSADYSGETGVAVGIAGGVQVPVTFEDIDWLTASGQFGRQWIDDNALYGTPDWYFYDFGLIATWEMFAFDLRYTDTDLSRAECFGGTELCAGGVVASVTVTLSPE